jgi:hypothetical protein
MAERLRSIVGREKPQLAAYKMLSFAEEVAVIARIWHGFTKHEQADAYESMLKPELLPGIGKAKGYRGSYLLRREAGDEVEFVTIMLRDSIDAIRAVAGPDYETAVIPEERRKYLSRHDAKSAHYEIASMQRPSELSSVHSLMLRAPVKSCRRCLTPTCYSRPAEAALIY